MRPNNIAQRGSGLIPPHGVPNTYLAHENFFLKCVLHGIFSLVVAKQKGKLSVEPLTPNGLRGKIITTCLIVKRIKITLDDEGLLGIIRPNNPSLP